MSDETPVEPQNDLTLETLAAFDVLSGRRPTTEEQRSLLLPRWQKVREQLRALRLHPTATGESALRFVPYLPPDYIPRTSEVIRPTPVRDLPDVSADDLESLAFQPVIVLSHLVRTRKVTSTALTKMYLERLKRIGPSLHCVVTLTEERALVEAERADRDLERGIYHGFLHGIPYGAKDNYAAQGYPTTVGAAPYREQYLDYDAAAIERLAKAGAVLCAKLSMGELAMGDTWFGGLTRNPWNPEQGSSGSSAGSASAVAAGLVPFALGTETLGSIISPSKVCGTVGLRPTFGRISRHGIVPLTPTMDKPGPICRTVEDAAVLLSVLHGPDPRDHSSLVSLPFGWDPHRDLSDLRVGIDKRAFDLLQESEQKDELGPIYDAAMEAFWMLPSLEEPVNIRLPERNPALEAVVTLTIGAEGAATFARLYEEGGFDALVQQGADNWPNILRGGAMFPAADYWQAQQVRAHLQREMAMVLADIDVYVTVPWFGPSLFYTNLTGHPEVIVRCGQTPDGLPVSLSFVGNLYQEEAALRVAHAFEQAAEWNRTWPSL